MAITEILKSAAERAKQLGLPYGGALTPAEAYEVWRNAPGAKLVDVRTRAEWDYVGRIPGAVEIELLTYPGNRPNPASWPSSKARRTRRRLCCSSAAAAGVLTTPRCSLLRPATPRATTCWKASRATGTPRAIAIPAAGGGSAGLPWTQT